MDIKLRSIVAACILFVISSNAYSRDWAKYHSDNFTIYSDERELKVLNLLNELETFRIIALVQLGLPYDQKENSKLVIYMYANNREFRKTGRDRNILGFYLNSNRGPRMIIGPDKGMIDSRSILFHEYVHYLFYEHSDFNYPRWYSEGIAEVLSTAKVKFDSILLGDLPESRQYTISNYGLLKINDIIKLRSHSENSHTFEAKFYASSWLLVHFLQINSVFENPELGSQTRDYLTRLGLNEDPIEAFEVSFGMTTREMDRKLNRYIKQKNIPGVKWNLPEYLGIREKVDLEINEKNYMIADLLWQLGEEEEALTLLEDTTEEDDYYAKASSLRAILLNHNENDEAIKIASDAFRLGAQDSEVLGNLAHYELDRYQAKNEFGGMTIGSMDKAEKYARDAIALNEEEINAYRFLADIMLAKNQVNEALRNLISASNIYPSNQNLQITIIRVLMSRKRADLAKPFIKSLITAIHSPEQRNLLTTLLEQIEIDNVDYEAFKDL